MTFGPDPCIFAAVGVRKLAEVPYWPIDLLTAGHNGDLVHESFLLFSNKVFPTSFTISTRWGLLEVFFVGLVSPSQFVNVCDIPNQSIRRQFTVGQRLSRFRGHHWDLTRGFGCFPNLGMPRGHHGCFNVMVIHDDWMVTGDSRITKLTPPHWSISHWSSTTII